MENNFEKLHGRLSFCGTSNIVIGVISILAGLGVGIMAIISGAKLLSSKSKLLY